MTFLKWSMLLGLAALAIPIVIHLLNRSKPRPVEWGAMQFLLASISSRRRRILIEDAMLLCLRCLAVALLALAMARPFMPSVSAVSWAIILPSILLAAVAAGIATVLWTNERMRRRLLRLGAALLCLAILAAVLERWVQARRWLTTDGGRDVAIILDTSMSMAIEADGQSNFERARDEARALIKASRPGDAFALILGGPVPHSLVRRPTSDRHELLRALQSPECRPGSGVFAALQALNMAAAILADGPNGAKSVIVYTDGHAAGWDAQAEARWKFVEAGLKSLPAPPRVMCRRLPLPRNFRNAVATEILLSRDVIGIDRPVKIDVKIVNAGSAPIQPSAVDLTVDGTRVGRELVLKDLPAQAAEMFRFEHRFEKAGYHVIRAQVEADDDLVADNALDEVVHVIDRLPVLVVEGASAERFFFRRTAGFVRVALTPREDEKGKAGDQPEMAFLVEPTPVEASAIGKIGDFSAYRVVILADVPRLPAPVADRLAEFVKNGGGLLVAPGARADPRFYNGWQAPFGDLLMPAQLKERVMPPDPLRLELKSFSHPALRLIAQPEQSDAQVGLVFAYWKLAVDSRSPLVRVGGELESKVPWLAERQIGKGFVVMTAAALDKRDGSLPSLKCFVPLVHELVYYLAAPMTVNCNVQAGTEWALSGALSNQSSAVSSADPVTVVVPTGEVRPATVTFADRKFVIRFPETRQPGLYRVRLPAAFSAQSGMAPGAAAEVPFTVRSQPEESELKLLTDADIAAVRKHVDLFFPESRDELLTAFGGAVPGQELWRVLVLCALMMIVCEVALTRWIAVHRHLQSAEPVALRTPSEGIQAVRERMTELLDKPGRTE